MSIGNIMKAFGVRISLAVAVLLTQHSVLGQNSSLAGPSVDQLVEDIQERTEFDNQPRRDDYSSTVNWKMRVEL